MVVARPLIRQRLASPFGPPNPVYEMVEAALRGLGLDAGRAGTPEWNPLGDVIAPGDRVLIQPSFPAPLGGAAPAASSTHGALLRPIVDYSLRAIGTRGRVTIADAPEADCDVPAASEALGLRALLEWYAARRRPLDFVDLRHFAVTPRRLRASARGSDVGLLVRERLPGDPLGYSVVDVAARSYFEAVAALAPRFCAVDGPSAAPRSHQARGRHEYSIPRTVLDADVIISLPRLATDARLGVAPALGSALGLTNEKAWLPRYTAGARAAGGDEYPFAPPWPARLAHRLARLPLPLDNALVARASSVGPGHGHVFDGAWDGNDTAWRAALDLNLVLCYADGGGRLRERPRRRRLTFVDGLALGDERTSAIVIAGRDPALVDVAAARALGRDAASVPTIAQALTGGGQPLLPSSDLAALRLVYDGPEPAGTLTAARGRSPRAR